VHCRRIASMSSHAAEHLAKAPALPSPRRRRRHARGPLLARASVLVVCTAASLRCWNGPAWLASPGSVDDSATAGAGAENSRGRRRLLQDAALPAGVAAGLWAVQPDEVQAFRGDRILNAKGDLVPKIRKYYQRLEGLRDDLMLECEVQAGNTSSRVKYLARVSTWYSGLDSILDGPLSISGFGMGDAKYGCTAYTVEPGSVALIARGRCTFEQKMQFARAAGAKSIIVFDERISRMPLDQQNKTGLVRSKGIATRRQGDAMTGASTVPVENGMTILDVPPESPKPAIDAVMISRINGTQLYNAVVDGLKPRVLDVKRLKFEDGIDRFIKKDLNKLLKGMESYSLSQRLSKDDIKDPVVTKLAKDRDEFEKAVRAKDYGGFRSAFKKWNSHLDQLGQWELTELL